MAWPATFRYSSLRIRYDRTNSARFTCISVAYRRLAPYSRQLYFSRVGRFCILQGYNMHFFHFWEFLRIVFCTSFSPSFTSCFIIHSSTGCRNNKQGKCVKSIEQTERLYGANYTSQNTQVFFCDHIHRFAEKVMYPVFFYRNLLNDFRCTGNNFYRFNRKFSQTVSKTYFPTETNI